MGVHVDVDSTKWILQGVVDATRMIWLDTNGPFQDTVGGCGLTSPIVGVCRFEGCKTSKNACTVGKSWDFVIVKAFMLIFQPWNRHTSLTGLNMWMDAAWKVLFKWSFSRRDDLAQNDCKILHSHHKTTQRHNTTHCQSILLITSIVIVQLDIILFVNVNVFVHAASHVFLFLLLRYFRAIPFLLLAIFVLCSFKLIFLFFIWVINLFQNVIPKWKRSLVAIFGTRFTSIVGSNCPRVYR